MALTEARHRLADTLLTRALDGTHIVVHDQHGSYAGHRVIHDDRLGLAILRRLDRLAETGRTTTARRAEPAAEPAEATPPTPASFALALAALAEGPETPDVPETHETHPLRNLRVDGDIRTPLPNLTPDHQGDYKRVMAMSYM